MTEEQLKDVSDFLILNGFIKTEPRCYANDFCGVGFEDSGYSVVNNNGDAMYSDGWSIYWLIGCLTYYGYMTQNYKKLKQ